MSKEDLLKVDGVVTEVLPGNMFRVTVFENPVIAHLSGKMKQNRIRVVVGDRVELEMTPYDLTKGRIVFRHK